MNDFDEADLDGNGEFNAIDIEILEGDNSSKQPNSLNTGCCIPLILAGGSVSGAIIISANFFPNYFPEDPFRSLRNFLQVKRRKTSVFLARWKNAVYVGTKCQKTCRQSKQE